MIRHNVKCSIHPVMTEFSLSWNYFSCCAHTATEHYDCYV